MSSSKNILDPTEQRIIELLLEIPEHGRNQAFDQVKSRLDQIRELTSTLPNPCSMAFTRQWRDNMRQVRAARMEKVFGVRGAAWLRQLKKDLKTDDSVVHWSEVVTGVFELQVLVGPQLFNSPQSVAPCTS